MKTVLDQTTRQELITRINSVTQNSQPQWGKMNVYQMLKHCTLADEMYMGKTQHPRMFLGRIIGKMALKGLLKDEAPMRRNSPTSPLFKVAEVSGDVEAEKSKWIALINQYPNLPNQPYMHWFFGTMTKDQIGQLAYKHIDHHLRQFGA